MSPKRFDDDDDLGVSDVPLDDAEPPRRGSGSEPRRAGQQQGEFALGFHVMLAALALLLVALLVIVPMAGAKARLNAPPEKSKPATPVAAPSDLGFCTEGFKTVLRRVLDSCGLLTANSRRGCTPSNVKQVAAISDSDFNALFSPLSQRAGILQFDAGQEDMSEAAKALLEKKWSDSRGASIFLVVARASPEGATDANQSLSHKRANSVLFHLQKRFADPELEQKVGLLWLGEEYAQLGQDYCKWDHDGVAGDCTPAAINRSAFVSWIDCQL